MINQKGFSPIIILIAVAVVIGLGIISYGYFVASNTSTSNQDNSTQTTVSLTEEDPLQDKVGTPDCPELDYGGCDTSGDFMTWTDDGVR